MEARFVIIAWLILSCHGEIIQLGTVCEGKGISIVWPDRSDIVSLEISFLKPGTGITNLATMTTTNRLLELKDLPQNLPDGRLICGFRWVLTSGRKGKWRLGAFDLWRNEPEPPTAKQTFISDGVGRSENDSSASADSLPVTMARRFDSATIRQSTNDAPVRAWHGAMQAVVKESLTPEPENKYAAPNMTFFKRVKDGKTNYWARIAGEWIDFGTNTFEVSNNRVISYQGKTAFTIDPELAREIAEHFNRPANPPPMPPSTNTNESATKRAMLEFYKHGPKR